MKILLTSDEIYFIKKNLEARMEWIEDNPGWDESIQVGELEGIKSVLDKLLKVNWEVVPIFESKP